MHNLLQKSKIYAFMQKIKLQVTLATYFMQSRNTLPESPVVLPSAESVYLSANFCKNIRFLQKSKISAEGVDLSAEIYRRRRYFYRGVLSYRFL
jgi:hypothetical protein